MSLETVAADVDAIGALALWIEDVELGEDRLIADVGEAEILLAAELPAQLDLPVLQRHVRGTTEVRELAAFLLSTFGEQPLAVGFFVGVPGPFSPSFGR